jgi:pimeloyl-ACP methyl ester carboxylesterase
MPLMVSVGGIALWGAVRALGPAGNLAYDTYAKLMPVGDREVFASEGMREMFIGDLRHGGRKQFRAALHDATLFGRDWGFRLADVSVPVRWWHGDADPIVPLAAAEAASGMLRDVEFVVRPGESHLGGFAAAHEVLEVLDGLRSAQRRSTQQNGKGRRVRSLSE